MKLPKGLSQSKVWWGALVALIVLLSSASSINAQDERLWLDTKINGTPARLFFDTGSEFHVLTAAAAKRFGLNITNTPSKDGPAESTWSGEITEACSLSVQGSTLQTHFAVMNFPAYLNQDFDGLIGWADLTHSVVRIHALGGAITFQREAGEQLEGWTRLSVATNFWTLELEVPRTNGTNGILRIDTGDPKGVILPARTWQAWKKSHPHCPMTVEASWGFNGGSFVREESWATNITIGPLVISDVPVTEAPPSDESYLGAQYEGTLGLAALKRLDLIVDGKRGVAHLRAKTTPPGPYEYNRAGLAVLPSHGNTNVVIVARVAEGGPAWEAGVWSGDTVLRCNGKVPYFGCKDSDDPLTRAAGTKLVLSLERGNRTFDTTVTLRQIFPTASP